MNTNPVARVALYLQDAHPLRDGMTYAQYAEQRGFEAVWQAESRLVRDAIVPMAAFAAVTGRIKVGSGVINNWTRNAALIAATFLTLDDLAPDRVICGIGAWWDPLAKNVGITRAKPLRAMREVVTVVRDLLAMKRVTFHGEFVHLEGVELDIVHGRREPRNVPIYIGATGDQMVELTGEIARRHRVELPGLARLQRESARACSKPEPGKPGASSTTSTGRNWSCAASTTTARRRSTARACWSRNISANSPTS